VRANNPGLAASMTNLLIFPLNFLTDAKESSKK
jgi:hypothetical protein